MTIRIERLLDARPIVLAARRRIVMALDGRDSGRGSWTHHGLHCPRSVAGAVCRRFSFGDRLAARPRNPAASPAGRMTSIEAAPQPGTPFLVAMRTRGKQLFIPRFSPFRPCPSCGLTCSRDPNKPPRTHEPEGHLSSIASSCRDGNKGPQCRLPSDRARGSRHFFVRPKILGLDRLPAAIGTPIRVGSSALGLMVRRDVDITVICEALDQKTQEAVVELGARISMHELVGDLTQSWMPCHRRLAENA
ncbi:hypothetical protein [Achromobacter sp. DMS1]|uniref:hypothetical protein n=1 Tax=Achromobacter sp. DMS1 TaxID=1688405 RepID=UPI00191058A5|nr:hypothetical protein [Achromobacter sp. DMS1]